MVVPKIFNLHHHLGKIPIFTNIFQMGWFNHQLVLQVPNNAPDLESLKNESPFVPSSYSYDFTQFDEPKIPVDGRSAKQRLFALTVVT